MVTNKEKFEPETESETSHQESLQVSNYGRMKERVADFDTRDHLKTIRIKRLLVPGFKLYRLTRVSLSNHGWYLLYDP